MREIESESENEKFLSPHEPTVINKTNNHHSSFQSVPEDITFPASITKNESHVRTTYLRDFIEVFATTLHPVNVVD